MSRRWIGAALSALALALALAGCGSSSTSSLGGSPTSSAGRPELTVSAASSLKAAFTTYATQFRQARVRYSFAGSDILAAQIEQGIKPDIFASANTKLPDLLYSKGLVSKPVVFAGNRLVIAVPANSARIKRLSDLEKPGVTIAIGAAAVPIGEYTRRVLARLGSSAAGRILANVRSEEADVSGIVGKLTQGAVDAGFTYITDVRAAKGALRAIPLPASLQPEVAYGIAVVRGSAHPSQARAFISGLLSGRGRADLLRAGFLPPP
jgi:molybdate transport system substrate-binding protein